MREAFGVTDHNDGLSTDDEQNNSDTTKFSSSRGNYSHLSIDSNNLLTIARIVSILTHMVKYHI